jgi:hypothetical protein
MAMPPSEETQNDFPTFDAEIICTCPEITYYFCNQFTPDLPIRVQCYTQCTGIILLDKHFVENTKRRPFDGRRFDSRVPG